MWNKFLWFNILRINFTRDEDREETSLSLIQAQWNLDITDWQNLFAITRIRYLYRGFFFIYFTITGVLKKIVRYIENFVM